MEKPTAEGKKTANDYAAASPPSAALGNVLVKDVYDLARQQAAEDASLEEEEDLLRKRRAAMQRRGDHDQKDEQEFEKYQADAMFRIQILEQRLARHENQVIKKFAELERTLAEDPRLAQMWEAGKAK